MQTTFQAAITAAAVSAADNLADCERANLTRFTLTPP